jgi:hypothetical protein
MSTIKNEEKLVSVSCLIFSLPALSLAASLELGNWCQVSFFHTVFCGRMVGADRVVKITSESGSAAWLPKVPVPNPKVGGVTQDMSGAHVDLGNWPVLTSFSLFYKAGYFAEEEKSVKEKK